MRQEGDVYRATVSELIANFRQALLALLPLADRAQINYADSETHRDWERLAECAFDTFVRSPISTDKMATGRELPLARYDVDVTDYVKMSWLTPFPEAPHRGALVRLLSRDAPFDTIQLVEVDPDSCWLASAPLCRSAISRSPSFAATKWGAPASFRRSRRSSDIAA